MARTSKKQKELTPEEKLAQALVPVEDQPYPIPENWCWVYLIGGFSECLDGFRKPINATERANREGSIPYYGATGQVGWINDYLTNDELVLLGEDGAPFLDLSKDKAYLISGKAWVNNHAHILKSFYGHTGNVYLMNYLNIFNYDGYVNGTTRLKLTQASMKKMPVPLPPLAEQQRIVDRIESLFSKLDEAKEKAQSFIDSYEDRKSAIMYQAFSGKLTKLWRERKSLSVDSWKRMTVKDVCKEVKVGIVIKPAKYYTSKELGTAAFRSANVREFFVDSSEWVYLDEKGMNDNRRSIVHSGDVLIVRSGNPGTACVVQEQYEGFNAIDVLIAVPNKNWITSDYLCAFTNSPMGRKLVSENKRGMALAHFNVGSYSKLSLYVPSIEEQNVITTLLFELLECEKMAKEKAEQVLKNVDEIKKSILIQAFCGHLGTSDSNDEPANALLERILNSQGGL